MGDLFSHIGRYHVMVHGDQSLWLSRYYHFRWMLIGNLGQDLLAYPLVPLIGAERAGILLAALVPPATVMGIRWLSIAAHGTVQPGALLALPFSYSFPFLFGFVNYAMGVALCLWFAAFWLRRRSSPPVPGTVFLMSAGVVLWLVHVAAWATLVIAIGAIELAAAMRDRGTLASQMLAAVMRTLPVTLVPLIVTLLWRSDGGGLGITYGTPVKVVTAKLYWLLYALRDQSFALDVISVLLLLCCAGMLLLRRSGARKDLMLAAIALCLLFLAMPFGLFHSFFADLRLLLPAFLFGLIALGGTRDERFQSFIAAVALVLFLVRLGVTTDGWVNRGQALRDDLRALDHVSVGARIAVLAPERMYESWDNSGLGHLASLAIPRREAFVNTQWDDAGSQLMRPIYNAGQDFNSTLSSKIRVNQGREGRAVEDMIAHLPRDRFDYVWLFRADLPPSARNDFRPVFRNRESVLYGIVPPVGGE